MKFQKYSVKIKTESEMFDVLKIDWVNSKVFIDRTWIGEWIDFENIDQTVEISDFKQ